VHVFNLAGYSFVFGYLIRQSSHQFASKIEKHRYLDKDLVEIKIALNLPYYNSMSDFEPFEGEITINNSSHRFVKRKVDRDTLYLLCLADAEKDKLLAAKTHYINEVNDFCGDKKDENALKKANDFPQYQLFFTEYALVPHEACVHKTEGFILSSIPDSFIGSHDIPPELIS
jgi:hypothetical protein